MVRPQAVERGMPCVQDVTNVEATGAQLTSAHAGKVGRCDRKSYLTVCFLACVSSVWQSLRVPA